MEHEVLRFWMTKLDAGLMTSLPAFDSGSAAVWGSKRIKPRPQSCLCLTWSGCPSNDDDDRGRISFNEILCILLLGPKVITLTTKILTSFNEILQYFYTRFFVFPLIFSHFLFAALHLNTNKV